MYFAIKIIFLQFYSFIYLLLNEVMNYILLKIMFI